MASRSLAPTSRSASRSGSRYRTPALLDPFRLMNSLLTDVVGTRPSDGNGNDLLLAQPRMNIDDTGKEIRVTAELPGVSEGDVQITLDDDMLIIAGEKRDEREVDDRDVRLVERVFGQFRRAIQLPFSPNPDQVEASFRDGVLTITVPKNAEQRSKQRQIEVKRDSGQAGSSSPSGQSSAASSGSTSTERSSGQDQGEQRAGAQRETADTAA
jgi:HSP20 family protein